MTAGLIAPRHRVVIRSFLGSDDGRALAEDVLDGLTRPFKELPPKHFYDAAGAELFDRICELPEYYPTRTERAILEQRARDISALTRAAEVVELGSGTATKSRLLLSALAEAGTLRRYVPIDVTETVVRDVAHALADEYPGLEVHGIVGDFERHLDRVPVARGPRIVAFLGGTIGNFTPGARRRFLRGLARRLGPDDHLLLGVDLVKDRAVLEAAYDDSAGVTAEFNRNMLRALNSMTGADFDADAWEHRAFYDTEAHWIEMHLVSPRDHSVAIPGAGVFHFAAGETILTEISAKHDRESVEEMFDWAGFEIERWVTDDDGLYAITLAAPR
jgi:L-histidine N-alpha-methyltransferase